MKFDELLDSAGKVLNPDVRKHFRLFFHQLADRREGEEEEKKFSDAAGVELTTPPTLHIL